MSLEHERYLSFRLGEESYAIKVERVEVVLESAPITRVPKAPAHLRGVINYRGSVIPVADLRIRFGEGMTPGNSSVIVLGLEHGAETLTIGLLADAVDEVISVDRSHIEPPPRLGGGMREALISGVLRRDEGFIVILDVDAAFAFSDDAEALGASEGAD